MPGYTRFVGKAGVGAVNEVSKTWIETGLSPLARSEGHCCLMSSRDVVIGAVIIQFRERSHQRPHTFYC